VIVARPYPANFWNNNFRLVVDDLPNAPVGSLNELVDGHAAKEGVVKFAVRPDAKTACCRSTASDPMRPA
jgi:hypothetical protein